MLFPERRPRTPKWEGHWRSGATPLARVHYFFKKIARFGYFAAIRAIRVAGPEANIHLRHEKSNRPVRASPGTNIKNPIVDALDSIFPASEIL